MKKVLFLLLGLIVFNPVFSQKVKYKKDKILVDKVKKYDFIRTKKGSFIKRGNFVLKDNDGNDILIIKDTSIYYTQLPNETKPRIAYYTYLYIAPGIDKKAILPDFKTFNFRKYLTKRLKKAGFFKTDQMTDAIFEEIISKRFNIRQLKKDLSKIESINKTRLENYKATVGKFGDMVKRDPNFSIMRLDESLKIYDGGEVVGAFMYKRKKKGITTYNIYNRLGKLLGRFVVNPSIRSLSVLMAVPGVKDAHAELHYSNTDKYGRAKKLSFDIVAEYLVYHGFL